MTNPETSAPAAEAATEAAKTRIRPNLDNYVPAKSGSGKRTQRTDDFVARSLDGKDLAKVLSGGEALGIEVSKWSHLNNGQQRMLVGNAIRTALKRTKDPLTEAQVTTVFGEPAAPFDEDAYKAAKAKAAEAKAAKEAKAPAADGNPGTEEPAKPKRKKK